MAELINWTKWQNGEPKPDSNRRCLVHAKNQWFVIGMYDPDTDQFWDKDGQPVVAVIEWSYRDDRSEL